MNTQSLVTDINDDVVTVRQGDRLSGSTCWRMCWGQNWWPPKAEEGAAYGAGILAMVGVGAYPSLAAAFEVLPEAIKAVQPQELAAYEAAFGQYTPLYESLKGVRYGICYGKVIS